MLFRRISQHVKNQNWFAVGIDFMIVVFGVFFGFQVTAWNEARTERQQEQGYLQRIEADISRSILRNETNVAFMNRHAGYGTVIINALDKCELPPSQQDEFASGIFLTGKITQPVLLRNAIDELNATGKFDIIQNSEIRDRITELVETVEFRAGIDEKIFLRTIEAVSEMESKTMTLMTEAINPASDITMKDVRLDFEALCADQTYKNAVATARSSTYSTVYFTNNIIKLQKDLLVLLEKELANKR